jgi:hypothetical protein
MVHVFITVGAAQGRIGGSSLSRDRILIVIGWNENIRKWPVIDAGRLIRRKLLNGRRRGVAALIPPFIVVYVIGHEEVHRLKLPHAVLLDVFVFIDPFPPLWMTARQRALADFPSGPTVITGWSCMWLNTCPY